MCLGGQVVDIVALALGLGGEFVDQLRQQGDHVLDYATDVFVGLDAAIQHAVEQVLDGPGEFADDQRAHHATTALEGVESAADFGQGFLVVGVGQPLGQEVTDGFQDFAGLFDEDFQQLVIHRLFVGGRRQQAGRHVAGRRVDGLGGRGHDIGHGQRLVLFDNRCLWLDGGSGQLDLGEVEAGELHVVPAHRGLG